MPRTNIIATLGPATDDPLVLRKMIMSGLDVARLNFSHGNHEEHIKRIEHMRKLNKKLKKPVKIMQDLEGYRLRIGSLENDICLEKKEIFYLTQEDIVGTHKEVPFDYDGSLKRIKKGSEIYIDDGRIVLKVKEVEGKRLKTLVVSGGVLRENKGINIPEAELDFPGLTPKDKEDVKIAVEHKLDYVAQSFVRSAEDIRVLRDVLNSKHPECKIVAKIENKSALINIDEIIKAADGIMVARGDLGVCLPIYKVPILQKQIIKKCLLNYKPVVVATQMMESMVEDDIPTRAEVSDIANAILDGSQYLLLSSETAIGKHPHKAVHMMNKVIKYTERYIEHLQHFLI